MPLSKSPAFNLKVVLQETNIAADTLRAWERRYGLPMPQRTAGGHRLYSQYDVETIKWLLARQAEGLSISRAVDMWNEHTTAGVDLLASVMPSANLNMLPAVYVPLGTTLDSIRAEWINACMGFSESKAEQVLSQAFSIFPIEAVCIDVLQKAMSEIGQLWYENKVSVQQEHFASGLAMRRLDSLLSASPAPSRAQTVLIGCPANEWHTFTPLLLALLLRRRGLNVIYLGANIPMDQFEETVKSVRANLVILVAQILSTAAALHTVALTLTGLRAPVAFGGRIFNLHPSLHEHIPGYYLGATLPAALDEVERLLKSKSKLKTPIQTSREYHEALEAFKSQRTHIESALKASLPPEVANSEGFHTGIQFMGDNIIAALQIGDMEYVTLEVEWTKTLLQLHKRPPEELAYFMQTYADAVEQHINGQGLPIKNWLNAQTKIA